MCYFLRCNTLFCSRGGPAFCCIYVGVFWAAAAFDGPILGCVLDGVLRVFRTVVPSGKWQVLTYSAGPIFLCVVMLDCPTSWSLYDYAAPEIKWLVYGFCD